MDSQYNRQNISFRKGKEMIKYQQNKNYNNMENICSNSSNGRADRRLDEDDDEVLYNTPKVCYDSEKRFWKQYIADRQDNETIRIIGDVINLTESDDDDNCIDIDTTINLVEEEIEIASRSPSLASEQISYFPLSKENSQNLNSDSNLQIPKEPSNTNEDSNNSDGTDDVILITQTDSTPSFSPEMTSENNISLLYLLSGHKEDQNVKKLVPGYSSHTDTNPNQKCSSSDCFTHTLTDSSIELKEEDDVSSQPLNELTYEECMQLVQEKEDTKKSEEINPRKRNSADEYKEQYSKKASYEFCGETFEKTINSNEHESNREKIKDSRSTRKSSTRTTLENKKGLNAIKQGLEIIQGQVQSLKKDENYKERQHSVEGKQFSNNFKKSMKKTSINVKEKEVQDKRETQESNIEENSVKLKSPIDKCSDPEIVNKRKQETITSNSILKNEKKMGFSIENNIYKNPYVLLERVNINDQLQKLETSKDKKKRGRNPNCKQFPKTHSDEINEPTIEHSPNKNDELKVSENHFDDLEAMEIDVGNDSDLLTSEVVNFDYTVNDYDGKTEIHERKLNNLLDEIEVLIPTFSKSSILKPDKCVDIPSNIGNTSSETIISCDRTSPKKIKPVSTESFKKPNTNSTNSSTPIILQSVTLPPVLTELNKTNAEIQTSNGESSTFEPIITNLHSLKTNTKSQLTSNSSTSIFGQPKPSCFYRPVVNSTTLPYNENIEKSSEIPLQHKISAPKTQSIPIIGMEEFEIEAYPYLQMFFITYIAYDQLFENSMNHQNASPMLNKMIKYLCYSSCNKCMSLFIKVIETVDVYDFNIDRLAELLKESIRLDCNMLFLTLMTSMSRLKLSRTHFMIQFLLQLKKRCLKFQDTYPFEFQGVFGFLDKNQFTSSRLPAPNEQIAAYTDSLENIRLQAQTCKRNLLGLPNVYANSNEATTSYYHRKSTCENCPNSRNDTTSENLETIDQMHPLVRPNQPVNPCLDEISTLYKNKSSQTIFQNKLTNLRSVPSVDSHYYSSAPSQELASPLPTLNCPLQNGEKQLSVNKINSSQQSSAFQNSPISIPLQSVDKAATAMKNVQPITFTKDQMTNCTLQEDPDCVIVSLGNSNPMTNEDRDCIFMSGDNAVISFPLKAKSTENEECETTNENVCDKSLDCSGAEDSTTIDLSSCICRRNKPTFLCSCSNTAYCSEYCQLIDWKDHQILHIFYSDN